MQTQTEAKQLGREKLERIIEMCIAIENRTVDPFTLNVEEIIKVVKEYFPNWEHPDELKLDAEALHHLASVIKLQSEWVKQRSSSLYTDPFLLEEKIRQVPAQEMADLFLQVWHPIVSQEKIGLRIIADGLRYWAALAPLSERWKDLDVAQVAIGVASREELVLQRVLSDREFSVELDCFWQELKAKTVQVGHDGKIDYWDFIGADTYEQTTQRAFLTSFLLTYGYAKLEINTLEEEIFILPNQTPQTVLTQQSTSVPIAVSVQDWEKWKRGKQK